MARSEIFSADSEFSIVIASVIVNGSAVCRNIYSVDDQQIFESSGDCAVNPQDISVEIFADGFIDEMTLNAAAIIMRESSTMPVHLPLLPFFSGERMQSLLVKSGDGFLLFAGDAARDSMFLKTDTQFSPGSEDFVGLSDASGLVSGDVLLVCDFLNNRSVMLRALSEGDEHNQLLVSPLSKDKSVPGFERFYSPEEDFAGYSFPKGTRIVKLAVPVEYAVRDDDALNSLYRRSNNDSWELVVPNIRNFSFRQNASPSRVDFAVSFDVVSEGIESEQIARPVQIAVSPRSLNRTFDAR